MLEVPSLLSIPSTTHERKSTVPLLSLQSADPVGDSVCICLDCSPDSPRPTSWRSSVELFTSTFLLLWFCHDLGLASFLPTPCTTNVKTLTRALVLRILPSCRLLAGCKRLLC